MAHPPGACLGRYQLIGRIGSGGMGEVYRAHDPQLDRDVAIKVLKSDDQSDPQTVLERFEREGRAAASLSHPHIARLYDMGYSSGQPFLVMELLDGESLANRLKRGPMNLDETAQYSIEISDALDYAHRQGLIHRDVKPANVFLTAMGTKLLDFGLAKPIVTMATLSTETPITEHGAVIGTYQYMSPEQLEGLPADHRSDIFAVGALMYEMLSGERAFPGNTFAAVAGAVLHETPALLAATRSPIPAAFARIIGGCLSRRPGERWPTAAALRDQLKAIRLGSGTRRATVVVAPPPTKSPGSGDARSTSFPVRSVAVLPLRNLSGDPAQDYFADGITEALITNLGKIEALRVTSRTSSMTYKGSSKTMGEIAKELRVGTIIEGSVRRSRDRVAINLQAVRIATDRVVWSEQYDRELADILAVENEVAHSTAAAIRVQLTPRERAKLRPKGRIVKEAYDEYLRGKAALDYRTPQSQRSAFACFTNAIRLAPFYAPAHAALAKYFQLAGGTGDLPLADAIRSATASALEAIRLDPHLAVAHSVLGALYLWQWRLKEAQEALDVALGLDPSDPSVRCEYAKYWMYFGRFESAFSHIEVAQKVDPRSQKPFSVGAEVFYGARQFDKAIQCAERAIELAPPNPPAEYIRSLALYHRGKAADAVAGMTSALQASGRHRNTLAGLVYVHGRTGNLREAETLLAELEQRRGDGVITPFTLAEAYAGVDRAEQAVDCLEEAYRLRLPDLLGVAVDPIFDGLHAHPRFVTLVDRIGLSGRP